MDATLAPPSATDAALDFARRSRVAPLYKWVSLLPNAQSASFTVTGGRQTIQFRLPPNTPFNLGRSKLKFNMRVPTGANTAGTRTNKLRIDRVPISRVFVRTATGVELLNMSSQVDVYSGTVGWMVTKKADLIANNSVPGAALAADAFVEATSKNGVYSQTALGAGAANSTYANVIAATNSGVAFTANEGPHPGPGPQRVLFAPDSGAAAEGDQHVQWSVALSDIVPHSILSLLQDLMFPTDLLIDFDFAPAYDVYYNGAAATTVGANDGVTVQYSVMRLLLSVQRDPDVVADLVARVGSGLSITCPLPTVQSLPVGTSTSFQSSRVLTVGDGRRLLRVYHLMLANGAGQVRNAFANDKTAGASNLIRFFYTTLNAVRVQPESIDCDEDQEWDYMEPLLQDSALPTLRDFKIHWAFCDEFASPTTPLCYARETTDSRDAGWPLDQNQLQYAIVAAKAATDAMYVGFYITQRELTIRGSLVDFR